MFLYMYMCVLISFDTKGMNGGDQWTARNNAFPNVPKKNHNSQRIIITSRSLSFFFICRELKNKIILCQIW